MGDASIRRAPREKRAAPVSDIARELAERIDALAENCTRATAAERCVIAWNDSGVEGVTHAPVDESRWDSAVDTALASLDNRLAEIDAAVSKRASRESNSGTYISLSPRELGAMPDARRLLDARLSLHAAAFSDAGKSVRIVAVAPSERSPGEVKALLELTIRATMAEIARAASNQSLAFWRARATERARELVRARKDLEYQLESTREIEAGLAKARGFPPSERLGKLGGLVAECIGADEWIVGVADKNDGTFTVAGSASGLEGIDLNASNSALAQCIRTQVIVGRSGEGAAESVEDRMFGGDYVCIPFERGAIALASRGGLKQQLQARAQTMIDRTVDLLRSWASETELAHSRELVNRLALRMFAAVDEERTKIARDLHDDQAQLLAAAKIALEGGREEARVIFKQIEEELRRKTRAIRPATLTRAALPDAIEHELDRLQTAGVATKLARGVGLDKIPRPLQQLCLQIVREAISNVIRHARAKSVEAAIVRSDGAIQISISDDGRGFAERRDGSGLRGMKERLELMGGRLTIQSTARGTTVLAEIPEPA